jgi:outer membrane protein assembly factor BamB
VKNQMKNVLLIAVTFVVSTISSYGENWPAWRNDNLGSGHTRDSGFPLTWGKNQNVKWRIPLPERGNSTPIVWGDRVFVTQAITAEKWRGLLCFNREDGRLLWKSGLTYDQAERTHGDNPYCSASPATDGKIVVAAYGSAGVAAYDFEGKELWRRDFGAIDHVWGNSTSPVIFGEMCFHYHGPSLGAALYGLDLKTGATIWKWDEPNWIPGPRTDGFREDRDKGIIGSFSTPIIVPQGQSSMLVMSFPLEMKAFEPTTGKILWTSEGLNPLVYTSPVAADGQIVAMGGYYGNSIATSLDGKKLWQEVRHFGGIGSGVIKDGFLYASNAGGVVHCVKMATGETVWKDRLPGAGKSWGSFILSGDKILTLSQPGDTVIFKANPEKLEVIAQSDIGEHTNSSLVISGDQVFIRTFEALWCIGK